MVAQALTMALNALIRHGMEQAGMTVAGNIDLAKRPVRKNPDGTISTVRSISFGTPDGEVLVPTIAEDGTLLTDEQAIDQYYRTRRHLGIFKSPAHATRYAQLLHQQQEAMTRARQ